MKYGKRGSVYYCFNGEGAVLVVNTFFDDITPYLEENNYPLKGKELEDVGYAEFWAAYLLVQKRNLEVFHEPNPPKSETAEFISSLNSSIYFRELEDSM